MRDKALFYRIIIQWGIEHSAGPLSNLGSNLSRLPDKGSLVGGTAGLAPVQKAQVQLLAASFCFAHPQPPPPPLPHFGLLRLKSKKLRPWRWRRGYSGDILLSGVSKKNRGLKTPQLRNENPTAFTPTKPLIKSLEGNSQKKKRKRGKQMRVLLLFNQSIRVVGKNTAAVCMCVFGMCVLQHSGAEVPHTRDAGLRGRCQEDRLLTDLFCTCYQVLTGHHLLHWCVTC